MPLGLAAVFVPKASDVLAEKLRELILSRALAEGTPLPTERELVAQSGLSRTSVREALRVLETEGLVATKAGRNGGNLAGEKRIGVGLIDTDRTAEHDHQIGRDQRVAVEAIDAGVVIADVVAVRREERS